MSQNKLSQHEVRKIAVQVLYSTELREGQDLHNLEDYILDGRGMTAENQAFLDELLKGVKEHQKEIQAELAKHLTKTWSIDRLTVIDRRILELGAYEIMFSDLPDKIAIDEAINLAKDFSDEQAAKLINGLLTNLIK